MNVDLPKFENHPISQLQNVQEEGQVEFQVTEEPGKELPTPEKMKDDLQMTKGEKASHYLKLVGKGSLATLGSVGLVLLAVPTIILYQFLVICPGIKLGVAEGFIQLYYKGFDAMWTKALEKEKAPEKTTMKIEELPEPNPENPPIGIPNGGLYIEPKNLTEEMEKLKKKKTLDENNNNI